MTQNIENKDLRLVYMGTPDFAVASLKALHEAGYNIVGVITMPDKPAGRGHKIKYSPVKDYALAHDLNLLQPEKLKDEAFLHDLKALKADLQIVVAFRMLPEVVWAMPRLGTFNLHGSLLPKYRGAAPINWAIMNGETETGITTFFLKHAIDTGDIIYQERIPIHEDDDVEVIHDKLMDLGATLVLKTVEDIARNRVKERPQEEKDLVPAPKLFKSTCKIDWSLGAKQIYDHIRGLSPYPASWTNFVQHPEEDSTPIFMKVYASSYTLASPKEAVGTILSDKKSLRVVVKDGYVTLLNVQLPGKKRLPVEALLRGYPIEDTAKML